MTDFEVRLTADADKATKEIAGFRKEYVDMVKTVEKPLRQIDAFKETQEGAKKAAAEYFAAKRKVEQLTTAMAAAKQPVQGLDRELAKAERTLARVSLEFDRQKGKIRQERGELRAAGVDTRNLAAEQSRLQKELTKGLVAGRNDQAIASLRMRRAELKQVALAQRQANSETAKSALGITRFREANQALVALRQQYESLRRSGVLSTQELAVAQRQLKKRIAETKAELSGLQGGFDVAGGKGGRLGGGAKAGAAGAIILGAASIAETAQGADEVGRLDAMLRLATQSQEQFNRAQLELDRIADTVQGDVSDLVVLYGKLQRPLRELGYDQQAALDVVEAVTLSLKISGATADESAGAVRQFAQALASGELRGDEFNSVIEQSDRLAGALADSLGVTVGELRALAKDGKLTTDVIVRALQESLPQMKQEFSTFAPEIFAGLNRIAVESKRAAGRLAKESGFTDYIAGLINDVAKGINSAGNLISDADEKLTEDQREQHSIRQELLRQEKESRKAWSDDVSKTIESVSESYKKAINEQESAEQKQLTAIAKLRDDRLDIERKYAKAIAQLNSGSGGVASFATANDLKVGAKEALRRGDFETAKSQADAALEMLLELQRAGENTYGLSGFAKELQAIELEAKKLESSEADRKLQTLRINIATLKDSADQLKDIKVVPNMDQAAANQVIDEVKKLAEKIGQELVIRPRVVPGEADSDGYVYVPNNPPAPGFADGGRIAGPGTGTSDSILMWGSNGEFMQPARAVKYYGEGFMESIRQMRFPRFAEGGMVGTRALPAIPAFNPADLAPANPLADFGTVQLGVGGDMLEVLMRRDTFEQTLRRTATKFGRTKR